MRTFSSYGPLEKKAHFYAPRESLIQNAQRQLIGSDVEESGHYITVWAPRQCGKTWIMNEVYRRLLDNDRFHVLKLELEYLKAEEGWNTIIEAIGETISEKTGLRVRKCSEAKDFQRLFRGDILGKPLVLILDEFDALNEEAIGQIVGVFRNVYNERRLDPNPPDKKKFLLHGVALIGVPSVLGVENAKGSPFNVQRSIKIPNLSFEEVDAMYKWYARESGQQVEQAVIERVFYETQGQPGLVSWFGELLTETYNEDCGKPIGMEYFEHVFKRAVQVLPNNNIVNIVSKAKQEPYRQTVLEMYKTEGKTPFSFDDPHLNFLYMNGVIDIEETDDFYSKFSSPFVQKRLFNYFTRDLFSYIGKLYEPFEDVRHIVTQHRLDVKNLMRRYEQYLAKNHEWLFKETPRRSDLRICEAVFHFNLYEFLVRFLESYKTTRVWPEFPTGNGKVDIIIVHGGKRHALEVKSYKDEPGYRQALALAASYAVSLGLKKIHLAVFVESIPEEHRKKHETDWKDEDTGGDGVAGLRGDRNVISEKKTPPRKAAHLFFLRTVSSIQINTRTGVPPRKDGCRCLRVRVWFRSRKRPESRWERPW